MAPRRNWTQDELQLALFLYFQLPFGKLHSRQPDIIRLAERLNRTPSAVAMKLVNLASLDPRITQTGRSGLGNASALDRDAWYRFNASWDSSIEAAAEEFGELSEGSDAPKGVRDSAAIYQPPPSEQLTTRATTVDLRIGQQFFRNAVLANFDNTCSVTGLAEPRVLVASHIRPWSVDRQNRLNPSNGLCLSATFDRAFDAGLVTVSAKLTCEVSEALLRHSDRKTAAFFGSFDGVALARPQKVALLEEALEWHRGNVFVDARA